MDKGDLEQGCCGRDEAEVRARGLIISNYDTHVVQKRSVRIGAQTELLQLPHVPGLTSDPVRAAHYTTALLHIFAPSHLKGGWIDHVDARGEALVDYIPASSLYHIYGAGREILAG